MVEICDAIMGTGKSSAAITYMNEHKNNKFIYVTPYLEEAERIKSGCSDMHFVEPSNKLKEYNFKKCEHTAALIKQGRNITTTHQAFKRYTSDMIDDIRNYGYTLIIDENLDVLEQYDVHTDDIQMAVDAGYIEDCEDRYRIIKSDYKGEALRELFQFLKIRELIKIDNGAGTSLYYWVFPPELITAFQDVIVLTYLFEGQSLHHLFKMYDIPYQYIGIQHEEDGSYRFCEYPGYTPEYVAHLKDMIHILDNQRMNSVGDDFHALSMNWFKSNEDDVEQLKKNMSNCMNNIWRDVPADRKLWGSYKGHCNKVRGKGYTKSFLTFNAKATNAYRDKEYLVYIANLFMNVGEKLFYQNHGIEVDEDMYALSIMVQWIWRSAIRDGNEVYLYIPSRRMRTLLINWIEKTTNGGNMVYES